MGYSKAILKIGDQEWSISVIGLNYNQLLKKIYYTQLLLSNLNLRKMNNQLVWASRIQTNKGKEWNFWAMIRII